MALTKLVPVLYSNHVKESIVFYESVLGFSCTVTDAEFGWVTLQLDNVSIMLSEPHRHLDFKKSIFTGSLYMNTNDVDGKWNELKDIASICYPIENFDYGMREFAIYDNNGYVLQFGQKL